MVLSRPHSRRALALLCALLFIAALLAAGHHQASAVHAFCDEHGRLIHLDRGEHLPPRPLQQQEEQLRVHLHLFGAHGCAALELLQTPVTAPRPRPALAFAPLHTPATGPLPAAPAPRRSPLGLAPKQSPPSA